MLQYVTRRLCYENQVKITLSIRVYILIKSFTIMCFACTSGAALLPCATWPSQTAYYLTHGYFTCKGNITKVHICPSGSPKITAKTLQRITDRLVIDTGVSRARVEGNSNIGVFEPPLQYLPGDHLGIEVHGQCNSDDGCKLQRYCPFN